MSDQQSWSQIVAGFTTFLETSLAQAFENYNPPSYRVFRMQETGTCVVRRGDQGTEGCEPIYGPATFAACLQWMNEQMPGKVKCL
ncbi:MAG TPA: hypothetical protein VJW77_03095 [Terriglobia bacterium]|nr:hypothetical protein [Terriglobia bacterium]